MDNEEIDDLDADPDWSPTDDQPRKRKIGLLNLQLSKRCKIIKETDFGKLIFLSFNSMITILADLIIKKTTLLQFNKPTYFTGCNLVCVPHSSEFKKRYESLIQYFYSI